MDDLQQKIKDLEKRIEKLETKRIFQVDISPGVIMARHFGQANPYILAGVEAKKPKGNMVTSSVAIYFATDTGKLWIFNGTSWLSITLS